jgi:hypothetical protein
VEEEDLSVVEVVVVVFAIGGEGTTHIKGGAVVDIKWFSSK